MRRAPDVFSFSCPIAAPLHRHPRELRGYEPSETRSLVRLWTECRTFVLLWCVGPSLPPARRRDGPYALSDVQVAGTRGGEPLPALRGTGTDGDEEHAPPRRGRSGARRYTRAPRPQGRTANGLSEAGRQPASARGEIFPPRAPSCSSVRSGGSGRCDPRLHGSTAAAQERYGGMNRPGRPGWVPLGEKGALFRPRKPRDTSIGA